MSILDAIWNLFTRPSATAAAPMLAAQRYAAVADTLPTFSLGTAQWPEFDPTRFDADAYRKLSLVFRAISLIAHAAGTAKVRVYDEAQDDAELPDHPMRRLIRQPNPLMGEARFWGTVAVRAGIAGFCVVEKERDGFGDVIRLNPLRSSWLKAIPRGAGVYDWEYRIPGVTPAPVLAAADAVAFTWADTPDGSPYGWPPLATAVRDVAILAKLTEYLGNLLDRGGVPQWMLIPDPDAAIMDQAELDEWTDDFVRRRSGFDRRGVPWLAEGIKDAKQLSYDPAELAMEAVRDLSENAIAIAFGVPASKLGIRLGLEHITQNATAAVQDSAFYRDTIVPLWSRFDDALTTGLLPDFEPPDSTVSLEFDASDVQALQEDRNDKASRLVLPGFGGGLLSNHMALRELGMPVPDGLPEYYLRSIATEAIPADDPLQLSQPKPAPPPPNPPPNAKDGAGGALGAVRVVPALPGPAEGYKKRKAIGASNKKLIASVADAREPSIRRFLAAQAERVTAHLSTPLGVGLSANGHGPAVAYRASDVDWTNEADLLAAVLRDLHALAGSTAFDAASEQTGVGLSWDVANPRIRAVMDRLARRVTGITETTRAEIAEIVSAGEAVGESIDAIAEGIRQAAAFSSGRATTIARTESMVSYGEASVLGYKQSGVVDRAQVFDNPNHTDAYGSSDGLTCAQRDGIIVPLDAAMGHVYADHPNGSACCAPVLAGEEG